MHNIRVRSTSRRLTVAALGLAVAAGSVAGTSIVGPVERAEAAAPKPTAMPRPLDVATAADWSNLVGRTFGAAGYSGSLTLVRVELVALPRRTKVYARDPFMVTFEASAGPIVGDRIVRFTDPFGRLVDLYVGPSRLVAGRARLTASFN